MNNKNYNNEFIRPSWDEYFKELVLLTQEDLLVKNYMLGVFL